MGFMVVMIMDNFDCILIVFAINMKDNLINNNITINACRYNITNQ